MIMYTIAIGNRRAYCGSSRHPPPIHLSPTKHTHTHTLTHTHTHKHTHKQTNTHNTLLFPTKIQKKKRKIKRKHTENTLVSMCKLFSCYLPIFLIFDFWKEMFKFWFHLKMVIMVPQVWILLLFIHEIKQDTKPSVCIWQFMLWARTWVRPPSRLHPVK